MSEGRLLVNGDDASVERSVGSRKILTLRTPLYIGGVDRSRIRVSDGVGVNSSFIGCISEVNMTINTDAMALFIYCIFHTSCMRLGCFDTFFQLNILTCLDCKLKCNFV